MKSLIFAVIVTWSFEQPFPKPSYQIVDSPKQAALLVEANEGRKFGAESNQYSYRLYEVNFEDLSVNQINIPKIEFK